MNAGVNQSICSSQNSIQLNGTVLGALGTGSWTASGSGAFNPANTNLSTSYSLTPLDISNGFVTFTLSSMNNSVCPTIKDTVRIKVTQLAIVNAGLSHNICSIQNSVALTGIINSPAGTGVWSSNGLGSFSPASSNLITNYIISASDAGIGMVILTLESTNNGPCPIVNDTLRITISRPAQVSAGTSQTICSTQQVINLNGTVIDGSTTGNWTSNGTGTYTPNSSTLNPTYFPSAADIAIGQVNFTLTSTNNGFCPANSSGVQLFIRKTATVTAAPNSTICSNTSLMNLGGTILGSTNTGSWTTTGSGSFTGGSNSPNSSYNISAADIDAGKIKFILTSSNNDVCSSGSDTLELTIVKNPLVSILNDITICENESPVEITGQIVGGSGFFKLITSGTGSFGPNDHTLPAKYSISKADVDKGSVVITLSSVNNGPCGNVDALMNIIILPSAHAAFNAVPNPVYVGKPIQFINLSTAANTYSWYLGDGNSTLETSPTHYYQTVGFYTVQMVANNDVDCPDAESMTITVISEVRFPNAFTPDPKHSNGGAYSLQDLTNDVFFPYTAGVTDFEMLIFNRWGELIFRSDDINKGWDGYFNGKVCQQDTYVWKIKMKFFDGRTFNETGSVTLLR